MKNQIKKTLAGLAAVAVIVSGASVFAEEPSAQVVTGNDNYWAQTFTGLGRFVAPDMMRISSDVSLSASNAVSSTVMGVEEIAALEAAGSYLGGKAGLFGKEDAAFSVENLNQPLFLEVKSGSKNDPNMGEPSGLNPLTSGNGEYGNTGNYAYFSFEMAVSDYSEPRTFQLQTARDGSGSDGVTMPSTTMLEVAGESGAVSVFNKATEYTMPLNKWVRYDMVIYQTGSKTSNTKPYIYVYADGELIAENIQFDGLANHSYTMFRSVQGLHFGFAAGESGCYIDNLVARKILGTNVTGGTGYTDNAKYVVCALVPESTAAEIDNEAKTITVPAGTAASAISGADVTFVTADGTVQETAQKNGFAIVSGEMISDDEFTTGDIYYTLTVEGTPEPAEDAVELTVTSDSGYYADTADGADKSGVVGFKTSIEKTGDPVVQNYGTFLLKSSDFDAAGGTQTEVANAGDLESGKAYVVEVENIGEADFGTAIYAKSFVQTADGYFYSDVISNMVGANGKWLGAK